MCHVSPSLLTSDNGVMMFSSSCWMVTPGSVFTDLVTRDNNNPASSQRHRALTGGAWFPTMSQLMTRWPGTRGWHQHVERPLQMENWAYQLTKGRNNRKMRSAYIHDVHFLMMLLCSSSTNVGIFVRGHLCEWRLEGNELWWYCEAIVRLGARHPMLSLICKCITNNLNKV